MQSNFTQTLIKVKSSLKNLPDGLKKYVKLNFFDSNMYLSVQVPETNQEKEQMIRHLYKGEINEFRCEEQPYKDTDGTEYMYHVYSIKFRYNTIKFGIDTGTDCSQLPFYVYISSKYGNKNTYFKNESEMFLEVLTLVILNQF
jgi:hypothetical protein